MFNTNHKIIIAGPCSVETEEQVMTIAQGLKDANLTLLRGGIWKPRTRPNSFEGVGEEGLPWLKLPESQSMFRLLLKLPKENT